MYKKEIAKQIKVLEKRIFSMRNAEISSEKIKDIEEEIKRLEKILKG